MEGNSETLNVLRQNLVYLKQYDDNKFFKAHLGTQSLIDLKEELDDIVDKVLLLLEVENKYISYNTLKTISQIISSLATGFRTISKMGDVDFINDRLRLYDKIHQNFQNFKEVWQTIGWMFTSSDDSSLNEAKEFNLKLQKDIQEVQTLKNSLTQQINDFADRYSDINTNVELETQVNIFEAQAKKNSEDSIKWLWGIIISGVTLIIILISIYCNLSMPADVVDSYTNYNKVCDTCGEHVLWVDMIRYIFFKLLIISTNIYILSFCVKNYNACMHNKTNNEHRHNSFRAALHFYNTTTSEKREEILIKVADAIFTYQKSGYYGKDSEPSNPSIIQSVIEKVSGKAE